MPSSSSKVFSTTKTLAIVVVAAFAILIDFNGSSVVAAAAVTVSGSTAECDQECGDHVSPICGSDGVTYLNACHFDRAYCSNKELIPMGYGPCER